MNALTISGKVIGKSQPVFTNWELAIPDANTTLGELLAQIVRSEIAGFQERQSQRRLTRILSLAEIELGMERGKIEAGGSEIQQDVDIAAAIDAAIQAFKDGFYLVFIDDEQQEDLNAIVKLKPNSELLFLRLTQLVGG